MDEEVNEVNEKKENSTNTISISKSTITSGLLVAVLAVSVLNLFMTLNLGGALVAQASQQQNIITGLASLQATGITVNGGSNSSASSGTSNSGSSDDDVIARVAAEVIPTGVPAVYGEELGISFDNADTDVQVLAGLERSISFAGLTETQQQRYGEIATTEHTACEYCCGVGAKGFGSTGGKVICGCAHNRGFSGLTKYLLQNHEDEYTNEQIVEEIMAWKAVFFPKQTISKELQLRAEKGEISKSSLALLPDMVGGC